MTKYFLDSTDLVDAITESYAFSERLLRDESIEKLTNEYAIKETRKVLKSKFSYTDFNTEKAIDRIRMKCTVIPTPPPSRFKKLNLRDKSDKPIVQSAIDHNCILVTGDWYTYEDAKKYVKTMTAEEVYKKRS